MGDNVVEAISFACSNQAIELVHILIKYRYLYCSLGLRGFSKTVDTFAKGRQRGAAELYTRESLMLQRYRQGSSSSLNRRLLYDPQHLQLVAGSHRVDQQ